MWVCVCFVWLCTFPSDFPVGIRCHQPGSVGRRSIPFHWIFQSDPRPTFRPTHHLPRKRTQSKTIKVFFNLNWSLRATEGNASSRPACHRFYDTTSVQNLCRRRHHHHEASSSCQRSSATLAVHLLVSCQPAANAEFPPRVPDVLQQIESKHINPYQCYHSHSANEYVCV